MSRRLIFPLKCVVSLLVRKTPAFVAGVLFCVAAVGEAQTVGQWLAQQRSTTPSTPGGARPAPLPTKSLKPTSPTKTPLPKATAAAKSVSASPASPPNEGLRLAALIHTGAEARAIVMRGKEYWVLAVGQALPVVADTVLQQIETQQVVLKRGETLDPWQIGQVYWGGGR